MRRWNCGNVGKVLYGHANTCHPWFSCSAGEDYSFWVRSVTFPAGLDRIGLPIDIMDDSKAETDETLRLHISNNNGPTFQRDNSLATITIKDRVPPPT